MVFGNETARIELNNAYAVYINQHGSTVHVIS